MNHRAKVVVDQISKEIGTVEKSLSGNQQNLMEKTSISRIKQLVQTKQKQAAEQTELWQGNLIQAQEQVTRWDAIEKFCRELLAEDANIEKVE